MKKIMYPFIRNLLIITILATVLSIILYFYAPAKYVSPTLPYLITFFAILTLVIQYYLVKVSLHASKARFISRFMLVTTVKLLTFLAFILIYSFTYPSDAVAFILAFFILYLIYTIFEIVSLLKIIKNNNSDTKQDN